MDTTDKLTYEEEKEIEELADGRQFINSDGTDKTGRQEYVSGATTAILRERQRLRDAVNAEIENIKPIIGDFSAGAKIAYEKVLSLLESGSGKEETNKTES